MGLINAINCAKEDMGLGLVECQQFLQRFKTPILIKKSWRMLRTEFEALDAAGFVALVQSGAWQPVKGAKNFTADIPDPQEETYDDGTRVVTGDGKPTFQFDYDRGIAFHKALFSKNSFGLYNVGIVDEAGTLVLALSADGQYVTGLTAGQVNTNSYVPKAGTTSSNTPFWFQLTNTEQYNKRMAVYTTDQSGIDFNEDIDAIISVNITGTVSAADGFDINIVAGSNQNYGIEAIATGNLRAVNVTDNATLTIGGFTVGATAGNYSGTLTPAPGLGDIVKFYTYDATATPPVNVALIEPNMLLKGESENITTVA